MEVVKTRPETWGGGIFECAVNKVSVRDIKVSDRPTEEERSPVFKSLVVAAESCARRPTLLPPRPLCSQRAAPSASCPRRAPLPSCRGSPCLGAPSHCIRSNTLRRTALPSSHLVRLRSWALPPPPYIFCTTVCQRPCASRFVFPPEKLVAPPALLLLGAVICLKFPGFLSLRWSH